MRDLLRRNSLPGVRHIDALEVAVSKQQVRDAPNIEQHGEELSQADESRLYHHYELNYIPPETESGRRLARR